MAGPQYPVRVPLERLPAHAWMTPAFLLLSPRYVGLEVSPLLATALGSMPHVLFSGPERTSLSALTRKAESR
jgi:hypothetical protein